MRPAYSLCHPPIPFPLYKNCIERWRYCYNSHRTVRRGLASSALLGPHYKNFVLRSMSLTIESCAPLTVPSIITHQSKLTIKTRCPLSPQNISEYTQFPRRAINYSQRLGALAATEGGRMGVLVKTIFFIFQFISFVLLAYE